VVVEAVAPGGQARPLTGVSADGPGYVAELSDGTLIRGRAVLFASGVEWRRLDVPGVDDLLGAGVYYGAGPSEALACTDSQVVVVGGGNSAGQAVVRFSRYAQQVTLLVRGQRRVRRGAACGPNGDVGRAYALDQVCLSSIGRSAVANCSGWPR
jgi:alkyl hydroperoxide reductase subunit AhpF